MYKYKNSFNNTRPQSKGKKTTTTITLEDARNEHSNEKTVKVFYYTLLQCIHR